MLRCYPWLSPVTAVCDLISNHPRKQILQELQTLLATIPDEWKSLILSHSAPCTTPPPVYFTLNSPVTQVANVPTRAFYRLLSTASTPPLSSLQHWSRTLHPAPNFNATLWKSMYCPLLPNKFGTSRGKLPTASYPQPYPFLESMPILQ